MELTGTIISWSKISVIQAKKINTVKNFPNSRTKDLVVQELENEVLIYDLKINQAFCLNETSALVFQLCNGKNSVSDLSDLMSRNFKALVTEDFIHLILSELRKNNLLENDDEPGHHFEELSRREIVKRVGLTSIIALPLILSIIAPSAAMAASGCTLFAPGTIDTTGCFTSPADCNLNFGPSCCSGMATYISQPCPLFSGINACACV
jgi:hypothetical protein